MSRTVIGSPDILLGLALAAASLPPARALAVQAVASTAERASDASASTADLARELADIAAAAVAKGAAPGLSIAVARGDEILLAQGFGLAELENEVPATAETVYRIGSLTKQFTAALVLRAVEQGEIGLADPLTRFLPDYPAHGREITVEELLNHTSGIPNYTSLGPRWLAKTPLDLSHAEMLALFEDEPLAFEPGTQHAYSNSGYYLLGLVLEKVRGERYEDLVESALAKPLGLTQTCYGDETRIIPHRAQGYRKRGGSWQNDAPLSMTHPYAAGGLCSSVLDLVRWQRALSRGQVVGPATYALMCTPTRLADGRSVPYGFGLSLGDLDGHPAVFHSGGVHGFRAQLAHYPAEDLVVCVLANSEQAHVDRIERQLARAALGVAGAPEADVPLTAEERATYAGRYAEGDLAIDVAEREDGLAASIGAEPGLVLQSQGGGVFLVEGEADTRLVFEVEGDRAKAVTIRRAGREVLLQRVE